MREADLPARQGRRLWAFLVLKRRLPVARDEIAAALWGDAIPDAWDVALNTLVSRLRGALQPVTRSLRGFIIRSEVGRYALELPEQTFVDLERARRALHEAERFSARDDLRAALSEARVAMEIGARGFLPGEEAPWIEGQRRALADLHVRAIACTVAAELKRGHPEFAEREARDLVALDPLREDGYRLLIRALEATGHHAEVARVLADARRLMPDVRLEATRSIDGPPRKPARV